eukprot:CAMPEP_0172540554 /NCGR_PEP_ID=MMETSP1067-20121228/11541_1 /TAXON_ID=265564 ORGANISM="Thalassiosira punctigera, Strain Tpunct2005C2" /NCGR_SAMPLE_ID=MMETSP1067 /ASSEMBLY_ACC=CAM_ASM_000444 /LENGTH=58 /DNA_ID=CAMNT_0013326433 /DNA_START=22 /DNA_END=196 /DNA_ORIENTATION=+
MGDLMKLERGNAAKEQKQSGALSKHENFSGDKDKDDKDSKDEHAGNVKDEWQVGDEDE